MSARVRFPLRLPDLLPPDDRALLGRFADRRDESAFAALVRRHAGMVLGVCRRAVRDAHLAEDAFQATFLVLARNPAAAARASSVAGWLFGVARRVGLAARRQELRRLRRAGGRESPGGGDTPPTALRISGSPAVSLRGTSGGLTSPGSPGTDWDDLLRVLDEELAALPDEYRAPLVACFLREQTQDEAARQLGWSLSTLRRRLDRAKELLRARLTRRGATLPAGLFAGALAPSAVSAAPSRLVDAAAGLVTNRPSPSVAALAAGGLGGSVGGKFAAAVVVLLAGGLAAGLARPESPPPVPPAPPHVAPVVPPAPAPPAALGPVTAPAAAAPVPAREWVTVKGRVVFPEKRKIPERREITRTSPIIKDADFCLSCGPLLFEDVVTDPKTRGLKNVVVWLRPDDTDRTAPFPKDKVHPKLAAAGPKAHTVTVECCQFEPRVVAARAGDTVEFKNAAKVRHNVQYAAPAPAVGPPDMGERNFNVLIAPDESYAARRPLPVLRLPDVYRCNIHQWMQGYVWAFDHPYSAVTAADGSFAIPDAPVGRWRVVVWQEKVGYRGGAAGRPGERVTVADGPGGVTDLGTLELESDG